MKIDVKKMDNELEKFYKKAFKSAEEWQIPDPNNLVINQEIIGNGSLGSIHKGTYHGLQVAVEVINQKTKAEISSIRTAVQQMVSVWFQLDHPNIIKCLGAITGPSNLVHKINDDDIDPEIVELNNSMCIVSEYPHGCSLKSYINEHRTEKLSLTEIFQLALDLARGLNHIHSKNIVHGDIKTENILLYIDNNVKITNFGVARVEETETTQSVGPNDSRYSTKRDVYDFGACLLEIYNGVTSHSDPNVAPKIPKRCPTGLAEVMKRCLDRDQSKRPSMEGVVSMLRDIFVSKGKSMREPQGCFCF